MHFDTPTRILVTSVNRQPVARPIPGHWFCPLAVARLNASCSFFASNMPQHRQKIHHHFEEWQLLRSSASNWGSHKREGWMAAYSHHQDAHGPLQRACVSIFRVCLVFAVVWRGNSITMFRYWFGNSMSLYVGGPAYYSTCPCEHDIAGVWSKTRQ